VARQITLSSPCKYTGTFVIFSNLLKLNPIVFTPVYLLFIINVLFIIHVAIFFLSFLNKSNCSLSKLKVFVFYVRK